MKIKVFANVTLISLLLLGVIAEAKDFKFRVQASVDRWQDSGYSLAKNEYAEVRAVGKWVTSHPPQEFGPSGEQEKAPGKPWAAPGQRAGCLLVALKNGNDTPAVKGWEKDDDVIMFKGPGKLLFIANDEPRQAGYGEAGGQIIGIPIGSTQTTGGGYSDNSGELDITITIKRND